MPEELGNEFQGSEAVLKLGFMAGEELVGSTPNDIGIYQGAMQSLLRSPVIMKR